MNTRSEILQLLGVLSYEQPELRLCQIIGNATGCENSYYIEDEEMLIRLKEYRKRVSG